MDQIRLRVVSTLKKYEKLNGYEATCWSAKSLIKHLAHKFPFSEYELNQAHKKNKIRFIWIN